MEEKQPVVYILRCADGTFYTGSTDHLEKRIHQHNHLPSGAKYTRGRRPVEVAYVELCETLSIARRREYEIKQLSRKEKEELITFAFPQIEDNVS